jgi:NADH dehydrogenase
VKVLVAGGSGFLGRHVVAAVRERGHAVIVLARGTRPLPEGAPAILGDAARGPLPLEHLAGCEAIVNLAGIKHEEGSQTFEAVHVEATARLLEAARAAGIRRFVHVSVVCSRPDPKNAYHDTKWRAEELVRASGLPATILKPGVVYGPGDDMVTHLVKMIRFAPVFPVVGAGDSILQPVDVRDVAEAVAAALERHGTRGRSYEIVGPDRLPLREVVRTVARGLGLPLLIVPTPIVLQRIAVRAMTALTRRPLSTPAQLRMLIDGLYGDPEPARRDLGVAPRRFTVEAVRSLEAPIPPLLGFSLRLVDRREGAERLAGQGKVLARALGLAAIALVLPAALGWAVAGVWHRMALQSLLLMPVALFGVGLDWRALLRPSRRLVAQGLAAAVGLYLAGRLVSRWLTALPAFAAQAETLYAWTTQVPPALVVVLLPLIVLGEEVVWRNAVTLPLAARLGPWAGVLVAAAAFAVAHLPMGVPLLLIAAFAAGTFWSALVVKTGSAVPSLVSHLFWDVAVMFLLPYPRT